MMDTLLPRELLLLSQALVANGAANQDTISQTLAGHPASRQRPQALFTPSACLQIYKELLAAEGIDSARAGPELREPNARVHLRMARKYYMNRLAEIRRHISTQEEAMIRLLGEQEQINKGELDDTLLQGYSLLQGSEQDPTQATYVHKLAAVDLPDQQASTELASTELASTAAPSSSAGQYQSDGAAATLHGNVAPVSATEEIRPPLTDVPEEDEEAPQAGDGTVKKSLSKPPLTVKTASTAKPPVHERRSSSRVNRASITNLAEVTSPNDMPVEPVPASFVVQSAQEDMTMPVSAGGDAQPSIERPLDTAAHSASMEHDSSHDSQHQPQQQLQQEKQPKKAGRPPRRASIPPARDSSKRRRTATPQEDIQLGNEENRGISPALSDRSRSKRVKTEEPESSLGTPDLERTPLGSDAAAVRRLKNSAPHLISQMQSSVHSTYFKDPVREGEALNYFEIIKRPMDFKTLHQQVRNGKITTSVEFTRDLTLIFANAIMYNGVDHHVGQEALAMWREAQNLLRVLEAAEQRAL